SQSSSLIRWVSRSTSSQPSRSIIWPPGTKARDDCEVAASDPGWVTALAEAPDRKIGRFFCAVALDTEHAEAAVSGASTLCDKCPYESRTWRGFGAFGAVNS